MADAAAREAAFLRGLEFVRYGGDALLVVGVALSIDRIATAPDGQVGRVTAQEAGGWALSLPAAAGGAEEGAAIGAALGFATGPGAIVTAAIGGLIGGAIGFFVGQELGNAAYDAGEHLLSNDAQGGNGVPDEGYDPGGYFGVSDF